MKAVVVIVKCRGLGQEYSGSWKKCLFTLQSFLINELTPSRLE